MLKTRAEHKEDACSSVNTLKKAVRIDMDDSAIVAVIATALFEVAEDIHDIEPAVLTIKKVAHSPWSSKIHGIREIPRK